MAGGIYLIVAAINNRSSDFLNSVTFIEAARHSPLMDTVLLIITRILMCAQDRSLYLKLTANSLM